MIYRSFDDGVVAIMEKRLDEFDEKRIERGLKRAHEIIAANNGSISSSKLASQDSAAVLALFEALCFMPYVAEPENRFRYFNDVFAGLQKRKTLKLGPKVLPTMTHFLFQEDSYRRNFAKAAWDALSLQSLTVEQFEWAVDQFLAAEIRKVSLVDESGMLQASEEQVKMFWEGFAYLLEAMDEEIVLHCLRGMEIQTDVYHLLVSHLQLCKSVEVLVLVLRTIVALVTKSSTAFWGALQDLPRAQLAQFVFKNAAFPRFLDQSLEYDKLVLDENGHVPFLASWVKTVIKSLREHEVPDVLQSLTDHLLSPGPGPVVSREGQTTRIIAGLYALETAARTFAGTHLGAKLNSSITYINLIINLVAKYAKTVINPATELCKDDRYNVGLSQTAIRVIKHSLELDANTTRSEWATLMRGAPGTKIPRAVARQSVLLWESVLEAFFPGREGTLDLAAAIIHAIQPYNGIGKFLIPKRGTLSEDKRAFNADLEKTSESIGSMIERLSGFTISDLDRLCGDPKSGMMYTLIASLTHSEEPIRFAGTSLIKTITGEMTRQEAVSQMVQDYFESFLRAFCDVVRKLTYDSQSTNPYAPLPHVLVCSHDLVGALCDTSGVLRSRELSGKELTVVANWWSSQWDAMEHMFLNLRNWSLEMEKGLLEVFCRQTIALAHALLDQDGVVASALRGQRPETEAMQAVLAAPRDHTKGMVDLIKLRDEYTLDVTVKTLVRLLNRLAEFNLDVDEDTAKVIRNACRFERGKFVTTTNMNAAQRAELLKALREDEDEVKIKDEFKDDVQFIKVERVPPMKQTSLDSWSKSGPSKLPLSSSSASVASQSVRPVSSTKLAAEKLKPRTNRLDASRIIEERKKAKAEKLAAIAKAKASRAVNVGEGSGLSAVSGILGKDHAPPQKSDMMVDSSEEEDEDDSGDEEIIPGMKDKTDPEARKRALELQSRKLGPLKKEKLKRSAKDMRARLIPPMDVLHQAILEWDIFHDGNDPPNSAQCTEVANTYMTHSDYKSTFFGLLLAEAWRSFVTSKDEATSQPFGIRVQNRMSVDKFVEVTTLMPATQSKDRFLSEGDIVIISKSDQPLKRQDVPHCLARIWKTKFKGKDLEVAYRLNSRNNKLLPLANPGSDFHAIKITNMTTIEREYAALESMQYYDLMDEILEAKPSPLLNYGDNAVNHVMDNYLLNPGQAKAIMNARDNDGFTLIQGPPGTGKTKTIVAMVGALLTGQINTKYSSATPVERPQTSSFSGAGQPIRAGTMKKLLVCAPSNAAVDELVLRLKQGVKTMDGAHHKISVLRLGRSDAINAAVKDVTLDELVKAEMDVETNKNGSGPTDREKLHQEAAEIKTQLNLLRPQLDAARLNEDRTRLNDLQRQFDTLLKRRGIIGSKIDADKDSGNTAVRESEVRRRRFQQKILNDAQVLCATLSGSGHEMFKNLSVEFETVIIDEAAQCVELSALIPLKYGCTKCILVGDPKQLPPTVLSQSAARYGYDQSLFVRMQRNHARHVHLLDTQYRMHPEISEFPSREFYEGKLYDGGDMGSLRDQPWHQAKLLGPYRFFDVAGVQERGRKGQSLINYNEIEVSFLLYQRLRQDFPDVDFKGKVGIITPYKAQLGALRERFVNVWGPDITGDIEFNTTDAFQGRECEIIIFSCVRASATGGIGFMTDIRRMNVGLTRAKSSLWILGDTRALRQGEFWNKLIEDARSRKRITNGDVERALRQPSERVPCGSSGNYQGPTKYNDVAMKDAPPQQNMHQNLPSRNHFNHTKPSTVMNEKGEFSEPPPRGFGPPEIGVSTPSGGRDQKKRPPEDDSAQWPNKRSVSDTTYFING